MAKKLSEFESALLEAVLDEFRFVPAEDEIEVQPSPKFEENAEKLIRKTKRTGWYYVNTTLKRAILIAAIIGSLIITAFAVPAIREAIIDFFVKDEGDHYGFTFDPEKAAAAPEFIEQAIGPTYVPAGYEKVVEDVSLGGIALWWTNRDDQWICHFQYTMPDDPSDTAWLGINSEEVETYSILLNDFLVLVVEDVNSYTLLWTDNAYFYRLELDNSISESEMEQIFSSITELPEIKLFE